MSGKLFDGQIALVTGGAKGIGRAIAEKLAFEGAKLVIIGREERSYLTATYIQADLNNDESFTKLDEELKDKNINVLINNAGINYVLPFLTYPDEKLKEIINVNLIAPFKLAKLVLPLMVEQEYGRIVNVASIFATVSLPGREAYSASKSGLVGMTRALALEVAKYNILVNCVSPGITETALTTKILKDTKDIMLNKIPLGRFALPEEIAGIIVYLASKNNTYLTGQDIIIDGGYSIQ